MVSPVKGKCKLLQKFIVEEFPLFWKVKGGFLEEVIIGDDQLKRGRKSFPEEETTWTLK